MKHYLLPQEGQFYKANMHTHTTISDGDFTPEEIKRLYMENGYSIVAYTDHEVMMSHNDLTDEDFLAINGVETITSDKWPGGYCYNKTYHINFYAKSPDITHCPTLSANNIWPAHAKVYATQEMIDHPYKNHYSIAGVNDAIKRATRRGSSFASTIRCGPASIIPIIWASRVCGAWSFITPAVIAAASTIPRSPW